MHGGNVLDVVKFMYRSPGVLPFPRATKALTVWTVYELGIAAVIEEPAISMYTYDYCVWFLTTKKCGISIAPGVFPESH
jgi:hypothetical protein